MNKITLLIKITATFVFVSVITVSFLYVTFSELFEQHMLKTEKEKVMLIAETIEPLVAMNHYLGLHNELNDLAQQIANRKYVLGGELTINKKTLWYKKHDPDSSRFSIHYPIKDPVSSVPIGNIIIVYSMESFNKASAQMRKTVMYYLAIMSLFFMAFALIIQYLLAPLNVIAKRVQSYKLGDHLNFNNIRMEPETLAIRDAFTMMVNNVREYTALLEQYKLSVDESSIVSKMSPDGSITYVNNEFLRVCGFTRDEIIGSQYDILNDADITETKNEIKTALGNKQVWKGIIKNNTRSNQLYYVKTTIVPLLDENNNLLEFISIQHDVTQVIKQREQLLKQTTDENTGLPNRIKLAQDVTTHNTVIFALFSLDNYDIIKNYYGYDTAYQITKQLGEMLTDLLESKHISVYKLAGGEFGLLAIKEMDIDWFKQICLFAIEKTEGIQLNMEGDTFELHITAGFTSNKSNYLSYAGLALRHALDIRKSLIYYEDQENLIAQYENNIKWTKKIKSALADDRITLFVQPLIETKSMKITKYECLVRLIDDDDAIISPFHFLDVAKQTKLYHLITQQVIKLSFATFSKIEVKEFSINLSAEDILHKETVQYLEDMINRYKIGHRVVLEIVESEGIDSFTEVIEFISKMKSLGCKIAIDDFGTGYSNFSYLMQLKVDYIKVDGSLIKDIDHNKNSQIICSTIMNFSSALNISTVAEFVHNEAVLNYVKQLGFDYLQGYHLGEPEPIQNLLPNSL